MHTTLAPSLLRRLQAVVGAEHVIGEPDRLLAYESDGLTAYRQPPAAVILPASTREVAEVLRILHQAEVAVVPRGAGTGLSGGALAVPGAAVVGTARMDRILDLDPENRLARVQPGLINARLTEAAARYGLYYAPDPSSQSACTLGGNVAENSGGPHCLKYGVTGRYVTGLTVVLSDGEVVRLGGAGRAGAPLDLVGLFVGSEGCFGVATEVEVQLLPVAEGVRTLLGIFDSVEAAGRAVTAIIASGLVPAAVEIMDRNTIQAVEASVFAAGYPTDAGAALVVEFDGTEAGLDDDAGVAERCCVEAGAREVRRARDAREREALWKGRKKAFGAMGRLAPDLLVQDATVPRTRLAEVLAAIEEVGSRYGLRVANVFHAGDGNLHPKLLFDRRDPQQVERVEKASKEIMRLCVAAGGTITGEHGVGVDKRKYMTLVHGPEELDAMRAVRWVWDPGGRLNPGKVLPAPGEGVPPLEDAPDEVELRVRAWCQEVREALEGARREGAAAVPVGTGRHLEGAPPPEPHVRISTARFDTVLRYDPADLTVTAGAGVRLSELAERAAHHGQWLPFDPPDAENRTLGGLVATGESGWVWPGFGALRNHVLGATLVTGDGRILSLGGRVVKNVAGFDLLRPVVGSRGRLGVITSVTLRLFPLPEVDALLEWRSHDARALVEAARAVSTAGVVPASVVLAADGGGARLLVRVLGRRATVDAECELLARAAGGGPRRLEGAAAAALRLEVRDAGAGRPTLRARALPARLEELVDFARRLVEEGAAGGWSCDAAGGDLRVYAAPGAPRAELEARAAAAHFALPGRAPAEGRVSALVEGVRACFDPDGLLWGGRW